MFGKHIMKHLSKYVRKPLDLWDHWNIFPALKYGMFYYVFHLKYFYSDNYHGKEAEVV